MTNSQPTAADNAKSNFWLAVVVLIALVSRVGAIWLMPEGLRHDTDAYRQIAETLRTTGTFGFQVSVLPKDATARNLLPEKVVRPTAFRPPLYPLLLTLLVNDGHLAPLAVGALHVVCGILTVFAVWILGRTWGLGNWAAIAAVLTACDPILLFQSAQIMTETVATLCGVLSLLGLTWWMRRPTTMHAVLAGLLIAMACLCRPTFLPWGGLVVLSCCFIRNPGTSRWKGPVLVLLGLMLGLLPWGLRNYLQLGEWKFTTTHGGYTLLLGNNPAHYRFLREAGWGDIWDSRPLDAAWERRSELRDAKDDLFALASRPSTSDPKYRDRGHWVRTEFADDQLAYDFSRRFIREDWVMFGYSCLHRVGSLWHLVPHQVTATETAGRRLLRWSIGVWYGIVYGLALVACWRARDSVWRIPWLWGFLLCVAFTAVHSMYWSNMRMRAPVMPFVALLSAAGVAVLCRAACSRQIWTNPYSRFRRNP